MMAAEWGGGEVDAMKQIAAKQSAVDVNWALHPGGSSAILSKLNATWPRMEYAPCLVGMEACATSHHWARKIEQFGHGARLLPSRRDICRT